MHRPGLGRLTQARRTASISLRRDLDILIQRFTNAVLHFSQLFRHGHDMRPAADDIFGALIISASPMMAANS